MIKLGVIYGGISTEHDVSEMSAKSVIENLNKEKYDIKIELVWEDNEENNSADYELGSRANTKINLPIHINIYQYNSEEG